MIYVFAAIVILIGLGAMKTASDDVEFVAGVCIIFSVIGFLLTM